MKKTFLALSFLTLFGCAAGDFATYDGGEILQGKGGFSYEKNGVDVYENSAPAKKFTVIGFVKNNLVVPDKTKISNLTKKAKEAGGDGIILLDQGREFDEFIAKDQFTEGDEFNKTPAGGAFSDGDINAMESFTTRAIVIKYAY